MAVSRRAGVALAQPEAADKAIAHFVQGEFQAHAFRVVLAAGKAVILLQTDIARVVPASLGLLRHSGSDDSIVAVPSLEVLRINACALIEIGRASCRERVKSSVIVVSL